MRLWSLMDGRETVALNVFKFAKCSHYTLERTGSEVKCHCLAISERVKIPRFCHGSRMEVTAYRSSGNQAYTGWHVREMTNCRLVSWVEVARYDSWGAWLRWVLSQNSTASSDSASAPDQIKPRASCTLRHWLYLLTMSVHTCVVISHRISLIVIYFVMSL